MSKGGVGRLSAAGEGQHCERATLTNCRATPSYARGLCICARRKNNGGPLGACVVLFTERLTTARACLARLLARGRSETRLELL